MNIEKYNEFIQYQSNGLKKQATDSVHAFVASFENECEVQSWVWEYLPKLEINNQSKIRHEIFIELIYPVIKRGYLAGDFKSTLWLGKLIQNVYKNSKLHEELDWTTDYQLYKKCYDLTPDNEEVRVLLLHNIIRWLQFCVHEWPSGILYGNNGANKEQCQSIREELNFAKGMDEENKYGSFFIEFINKLIQYEARLNGQK